MLYLFSNSESKIKQNHQQKNNMKKTILSALLVTGLSVTVFGQGNIAVNNLANTGGGSKSTAVYSALVTSGGLIFTADTGSQAKNNGGNATTAEWNDIGFMLYGGATAGTVNNLLITVAANANTVNGGSDDSFGDGTFSGNANFGVPGSSANATVFLNLFVWENYSLYST
jgi:hypothetical protein